MRILFLCSSLAPGIDGVGDYTRRLAAACAERGHPCLLLALHDRHITAPLEETGTDARLRIVRWPAGADWSGRLSHLPALVRDFGPERTSWQFVPYGYHPKGIPPVAPLRQIAAHLPASGRHALLHELWIGLSAGESLKNRLVGALQRQRLLSWLRVWAPAALATTNPVYQAVLSPHGHRAGILPLFGNLPIGAPSPDPKNNPSELTTVVFGTLHPQWNPRPAARFLNEAARLQGRRLRLRIAGRSGSHAAVVKATFADVTGQEPEILGELTPAEASAALHAADLGLAPHPWALIGKSGAAAALLEHGLPVIVPRDDWTLRSGATPPPEPDARLARLKDLNPAELTGFLARRTTPASRLDAIASRFLASI